MAGARVLHGIASKLACLVTTEVLPLSLGPSRYDSFKRVIILLMFKTHVQVMSSGLCRHHGGADTVFGLFLTWLVYERPEMTHFQVTSSGLCAHHEGADTGVVPFLAWLVYDRHDMWLVYESRDMTHAWVVLIEITPTPRGVSFLICFSLRMWREEDKTPPCKTPPILPTESNQKGNPPGKRFFFDQCLQILFGHD